MTLPKLDAPPAPTKPWSYVDVCAWIVISVSLVGQVNRFAQNKGLLYNECRVALNILDRDYLGLTRPLDYQQTAPIGLLWAGKFSVQILGNHEFSLRLFSLFAGLATPVVYWIFARQFGSPRSAAIGTLILSLNYHVLLYSGELKEYSLDVATSACLLALGAWLTHSRNTFVRIIAAAIVLAAALWFSDPAVYVVVPVWLGITGTVLFPLWKSDPELRLQRPLALAALAIGTAIIGFSFVENYRIVVEPFLARAWHDEPKPYVFAPYPPNYLADVFWYFRAFGDLLISNRAARLKPLLMAGPFFIGLIYVFCKRPWLSVMLALPPCVAVVASMLQRSFFADEYILFLQPAVVFLVAQGIEQIVRLLDERRPRLVPCAMFAATAYCVVTSAIVFSRGELRHWDHLDTRPSLAHVSSGLAPEDVVYVTQSMYYPFRYYAPFFRSADGTGLENWPALFLPTTAEHVAHEGIDPSGYAAEIDQALSVHPSARRVWVLTSQITWMDYEDVRPVIRSILEMRGSVEQFDSDGATAFLLTIPADGSPAAAANID